MTFSVTIFPKLLLGPSILIFRKWSVTVSSPLLAIYVERRHKGIVSPSQALKPLEMRHAQSIWGCVESQKFCCNCREEQETQEKNKNPFSQFLLWGVISYPLSLKSNLVCQVPTSQWHDFIILHRWLVLWNIPYPLVQWSHLLCRAGILHQ